MRKGWAQHIIRKTGQGTFSKIPYLLHSFRLLEIYAVRRKLESKLDNIDENIEIVYKDKLFEEAPVSENEQ